MAHAFNPNRDKGRQISEFEVYRVSSRTAKAIQRNPVSKQTNRGWRGGSEVKSIA